MATATTTVLKTYFNTGDKPTQQNFHDQLESYLNVTDGGTVAGATNFTGAVNLVKDYESITAATKAVTAADSGTVYGLNRAGGIAVTLPTPAAGVHYTFVIETTFTTAGTITTATTDGTDGFVGYLSLNDPTTAGDMNTFIPAASNDFIDLGQIEQGWLAGGVIKLTGLNTTTWLVEGHLIGDATLETPFQDAA